MAKAYPITDHYYDCLVVGRRRLRPARRGRHGRGRPQGRLHHQGLPDPLAHRGGPGRDQRRARQHERGRLALPHVRHRQGVGLAGRPGRDRVHDQERAGRGLRARALRRAVLAHRPRARSTSAPSAASRPTTARARPTAPAPPPTAPATSSCTRLFQQALKNKVQFFNEYFALDLIMDDEGACRGVMAMCIEDGSVHRFHGHLTCLATGGYGRVYASRDLGPHLHRRRQRHGAARRPAAAGHGVRPVPPDGHRRRRLPDHRGRARRGRLPHQLRGRALHGALRPQRQGPGLARRGQPGRDDRDQRGARLRAPTRTTSTCISSISTRSSCTSGCPASRRRRGSSPGSTSPSSRSRSCRPATTTWAASRPTGAPRWCARTATPDVVVPGLMAVGEAACASVHGANRLGGNSLIDLVVFGRAAAHRPPRS